VAVAALVERAALPLAHGGLGVGGRAAVVPAAALASWVDSLWAGRRDSPTLAAQADALSAFASGAALTPPGGCRLPPPAWASDRVAEQPPRGGDKARKIQRARPCGARGHDARLWGGRPVDGVQVGPRVDGQGASGRRVGPAKVQERLGSGAHGHRATAGAAARRDDGETKAVGGNGRLGNKDQHARILVEDEAAIVGATGPTVSRRSVVDPDAEREAIDRCVRKQLWEGGEGGMRPAGSGGHTWFVDQRGEERVVLDGSAGW